MFAPKYLIPETEETNPTFDWVNFGKNTNLNVVYRFNMPLCSKALATIINNRMVTREHLADILKTNIHYILKLNESLVNIPVGIPPRDLWFHIIWSNKTILFLEKNAEIIPHHILYYMCTYAYPYNCVKVLEKRKDDLCLKCWECIIIGHRQIEFAKENINLLKKLDKENEHVSLQVKLVKLFELHYVAYKKELVKKTIAKNLQKKKYEVKLSDIEQQYFSGDEETILRITKNVSKLTPKYWDLLCKNPNAIPFLMKHAKRLSNDHLHRLTFNPNAVPILDKYAHRLDMYEWEHLVKNPDAWYLIDRHFDTFNVECLQQICNYRAMIPIFKKHMEEIFNKGIMPEVLHSIALNPDGIPIIEKYIDILDEFTWSLLANNKRAQYLIDKYPANVPSETWVQLCNSKRGIKLLYNNIDYLTDDHWCNVLIENPYAINLIKKYLYRFNQEKWDILALNRAAIPIIVKNYDRLSLAGFNNLCLNPSVYKIQNVYELFIDFKLHETCSNYGTFIANSPFAGDVMRYLFKYDEVQMCNSIKDLAEPIIRFGLDPKKILMDEEDPNYDKFGYDYEELFIIDE